MEFFKSVKSFFNPTKSEQSPVQPEVASSQAPTSRSPKQGFLDLAPVGDRQRVEGNASELRPSAPLPETDQSQVASSQVPISSIGSTKPALSSQPKPELYTELGDREIVEIMDSIREKFKEKERELNEANPTKRKLSPEQIDEKSKGPLFPGFASRDPDWISYLDKISPQIKELEKQKNTISNNSESVNEALGIKDVERHLNGIEYEKKQVRRELTADIIKKISGLSQSAASPPKSEPSKSIKKGFGR